MSRLRSLLHELADELADRLEAGAEQARYYDQDSSPLPRDTFLRLVRDGALAGHKVGRRVLVKREDVHRFIEQPRLEVVPLGVDRDALVTAGLKQLGVRRAG